MLSPRRSPGRRAPRQLRPSLVALGVLASTAGGAVALRAGEPLAGGRLQVGLEASGTLSPEDEGYFNYGDYETNTLRLLRLDVVGELRLARAVSLLADVRVENFSAVRVYALYLRVRPWAERDFDLQAGLVPPVFGAYPRRRYASENPLPSVPLAYQYLHTLRDDAVPSRTEDLVAQRGRGWLVRYPVGSPGFDSGRPIVNGERWDVGVEARVAGGPIAFAAAVTQGTLSSPQVEDDNDGKQLSARLAWSPGPGLTLGVSGASGEFLERQVQEAFASRTTGSFRQDAAGLDVEWSRGRWIARAEAVWARWRLPALDATRIEEPLEGLGAYVEARCKVAPGVYAAARLERLAFDRVASTLGESSWDAPVTRVEAGAGWSPWRRVTLKLAWQHNERDGGRVRGNDLLAGQVVLWY